MEIVIVLVLILLNGIFSMSEIALVSSKTIRLEQAAKKGSSNAKIALELARSPTRFLSAVQIGITLIGILMGIYSGEHLTKPLKLLLDKVDVLQPYSYSLATGIVVVVLTYFSLVLGELVPKRIGLTNPEGIARLVARPMNFISKLGAPFIWFLTATSDMVMRLLSIKPANETVTEEEIKAMVEEGARSGEVQEIEQQIVERVFRLGDRKVGSLMTPREEVVFLDLHASGSAIREAVNPDTHTVYPVYEDNIHNIVGMVTLKDLFSNLANPDFSLANFLHPTRYLAENISAYKALVTFKRRKAYYGIITDEYGSTLGIITMKDILAALVGHYSDLEMDETGITLRSDNSWLVDGDYPYPDFIQFYKLPDPGHQGFNTVAGLVLHELERIPRVGEKLRWQCLEMEILDMDRARIDKILVRRL